MYCIDDKCNVQNEIDFFSQNPLTWYTQKINNVQVIVSGQIDLLHDFKKSKRSGDFLKSWSRSICPLTNLEVTNALQYDNTHRTFWHLTVTKPQLSGSDWKVRKHVKGAWLWSLFSDAIGQSWLCWGHSSGSLLKFPEEWPTCFFTIKNQVRAAFWLAENEKNCLGDF